MGVAGTQSALSIKRKEMAKKLERFRAYLLSYVILGDEAYCKLENKEVLTLKEAKQLAVLNPKIAVPFVRDVLGKRWKEAEPVILANPEEAYLYARDVLKRRWPRAEPIIAQSDPKVAVWYARDVMEQRWKEAEPMIAEFDHLAQMYAERLVRHWTPEFAKQSPVWLYMYADRVSCGKLPPELHNRMLMWSFDDTMKNNGWVRKYFAGRKFKKR